MTTSRRSFLQAALTTLVGIAAIRPKNNYLPPGMYRARLGQREPYGYPPEFSIESSILEGDCNFPEEKYDEALEQVMKAEDEIWLDFVEQVKFAPFY